MFRQKIRSGILLLVAIMTCPCHLPIVLPIAISLLAGTPAAIWLSQNVGWVYGGMTLLFLASLTLGLIGSDRSKEKTGEACKPRSKGSIHLASKVESQ